MCSERGVSGSDERGRHSTQRDEKLGFTPVHMLPEVELQELVAPRSGRRGNQAGIGGKIHFLLQKAKWLQAKEGLRFVSC